jgi:hypothetical protein
MEEEEEVLETDLVADMAAGQVAEHEVQDEDLLGGNCVEGGVRICLIWAIALLCSTLNCFVPMQFPIIINFDSITEHPILPFNSTAHKELTHLV